MSLKLRLLLCRPFLASLLFSVLFPMQDAIVWLPFLSPVVVYLQSQSGCEGDKMGDCFSDDLRPPLQPGNNNE